MAPLSVAPRSPAGGSSSSSRPFDGSLVAPGPLQVLSRTADSDDELNRGHPQPGLRGPPLLGQDHPGGRPGAPDRSHAPEGFGGGPLEHLRHRARGAGQAAHAGDGHRPRRARESELDLHGHPRLPRVHRRRPGRHVGQRDGGRGGELLERRDLQPAQQARGRGRDGPRSGDRDHPRGRRERRLRRDRGPAARAGGRDLRALPPARRQRPGLLGGEAHPGRGQRVAQPPHGPGHGLLRGRGGPGALPRDRDALGRGPALPSPGGHRRRHAGARPGLQPRERPGPRAGAGLPDRLRARPGALRAAGPGRSGGGPRSGGRGCGGGLQPQVRSPRGPDLHHQDAARHPARLRSGGRRRGRGQGAEAGGAIPPRGGPARRHRDRQAGRDRLLLQGGGELRGRDRGRRP